MSILSNSSSPAGGTAPNPHLLHTAFLPVEPVLELPIVAFMRLRRMARSAHEIAGSYRDLLRLIRRARARLEAGPFNAHRVAQLDANTKALEAELKFIRSHVQHVGAVLIDLAPEIDKVTTLGQRLELLNCNCADRADLGQLDETAVGMMHLMAVYCVEDSAEHRNDEWNDRPLHEAVNAEVHRVMFSTPEGKEASKGLFDELFASGGMFEKIPRYYRQPDGTMLRQGPPLTVHDADGSRVVERKPS